MANLENLYRQLIMDHYKNPRNKGLVEDENYKTIEVNNPSCGDEITIQVKIEGNIISDVRHAGKGCSISMSSASVMSQTIKGKTVEEANEIIDAYYNMLKGEEPLELLEDAVAYNGISKFPARYKCATISWNALCDALGKK